MNITSAAVGISGAGCAVGALSVSKAVDTAIALAYTTVAGAVSLMGNKSGIELGFMNIRGALVCLGNTPAPINAGGLVVGGATVGQCTAGSFASDQDAATVPAVTVGSATLKATLGAALAVDNKDAVPGDPLTYSATVTNTGSLLTLSGDLTIANPGNAATTVQAFSDTIFTAACIPAPGAIPSPTPGLVCQKQTPPDPKFPEECACPAGIPGPLDAVLRFPYPSTYSPWSPLAGVAAAVAGFTPLVSPPSTSGLTLTLTPVAASGVRYPNGGQIPATTIGAAATARWHYTATVSLSAAQAATLTNATLTAAVKDSFHVEGAPNPDAPQDLGLETADSLFCAELYNSSLMANAEGVSVTITPPSGPSVTTSSTGKNNVPALASIAPGASVTVTDKYTVPVAPARTPAETDAAYLAALQQLDKSLLTAHASANATVPAGATATANPATTTEHVPIVGIAKTGPASARGGTTAVYQLALANGGSAPANGLGVTDTVSGGGVATVTGVPATLAAGASAKAQASYTIPPTQPSGPLADTASVTWKDANGNVYGPFSSSFTTKVGGPPTVTKVTPPSGQVAGGNSVTVIGTNLTDAFEVDFGAAKVTSGIVVSPDGTSLTVDAPSGTVGTVDIRVTTPSGTSAVTPADHYTYTTPPATPFTGSQLTLAPSAAGPNPTHTTQTLQATLTDRNHHPEAGLEIAFGVTGANPSSATAPTDGHGVATFTYTGANAGTDSVTATFHAAADTATSNNATVSWVTPTAPVAVTSIDPVVGNFYAEPSAATTFAAHPGDTPAFGQTFPDIAFNPPAGSVPGNTFGVTPSTHPLTDVTTNVVGDAVGTLPAQGNGVQAGVGSLASFDAVFTTTIHVAQAGDLSYTIEASDGFLLGVGNGASRVQGDFVNPPASHQSVFSSYPLVAAYDQPAGGAVLSHPVTIAFPTAGDYPIEIDYFSVGGPLLSLVFSPSVTVLSEPNTPPVNVYVGYQDTLRASNDFTISPLPWFGSPGVVFEGDSSAEGPGADSGGIRFDNVTNAPITLDQITVDIPRLGAGTPFHFDQWPKGIVIPVGQTVILAEDAGFASFDTSDFDGGPCGVVQPAVPAVNVTIGGVTSVFYDTGEVLNTAGFDQACLGNESEPWSRIGTSGPAHPLVPKPRVGAAAAWDTAANALVVFGGYQSTTNSWLGDTWAWQKEKWTPVTPAVTPPPRAFAAGAYDAATSTFVLFGGYNDQTGVNYNDTWTFDGTTWTQQHPVHSPPALNRASDRAVYDPSTRTVVLVTSDALGSTAPDTWTWNGTDWTEHATATQPTARWQPSLGYDPATQAVVLFGGSAGYQGTDLGDTWKWDGSNWTQLQPAASPSPRTAATMDYDPVAGGMILFGGDQGSADTWLYKAGTWSQLTPPASPPGRDYASSAYDPVDQQELVAFGYQNANGVPLGDLWLFNGQNWGTNLPEPVIPAATSLAISPAGSQTHPAGQAQSLLVSLTTAAGQPLPGTAVTVTTTGANPSTRMLTTDANGTATFTDGGNTPGLDQIRASAVVNGATQTSNAVAITWTAPTGPPPAISAAQPADGSVIKAPTAITATVSPPPGQTIANWSVTVESSAPGSAPVTLASGTGTPPPTLGTFDPTVLSNGQYDITVSATASGGGVQSVVSAVSVAGSMKLGFYQATYHELTVPVKGLSMTVDRVYNSTDNSARDFGPGWKVAISNFQVGTGRPLGSGGWQEYPTSCSLLGCNYAFKTTNVSHAVTVTWPDGHQEISDFAPTGSSFGGLQFLSPAYTARPGTNTTDTLASGGSLAFGGDGNLYNSTFAQANNGTIYDPTEFTLTTPAGTVYQLDATTGLVSETDPSGNSITIDSNGVHGSNGQSVRFTRDPANGNRITKITGPDDGVGGLNQHWTYAYNAAGKLASVTDPLTTVNYAYDSSGRLTSSTDNSGATLLKITYGTDGRVSSVANGPNPPTVITAAPATRSQTVTDPNGKLTTTQHFDTAGDVIEEDQAYGTTTLKTTYTYDSSGRRTSTTDPTGAKTSTTYDETPGPTNGNVLSTTDADGRTTTYSAYNQWGQSGETIGPNGAVTDVKTFDPTTGLTLTDDVPGLAPTVHTYNPDGTTATTTDPAGRVTSYTYDASGNQTSQSDSAGHAIRTKNDASGQVATLVDQSGHETDYTHDGNGNVTSAVNAQNGAKTTATYNAFNKPIQLTDPDGHTTTYNYDQAGRITSRDDPDGPVVVYTYNADGKLASETTPNGIADYSYDPLNRLTQAENQNSELNFRYDNAGNILTETTCAPQPASATCPAGSTVVTHTVDLAGLITSTTDPAGTTIYQYDSDGRLSQVIDPSNQTFLYSYDQNSRLNGFSRPNGVSDTKTFNDANQPLSLTTAQGSVALASMSNTLDPVTGFITAMTDLAGTNTYSYNANGTLAAATHPAAAGLTNETYTYDSAQNRLTGPSATSSSTYDLADRLLSDGTANYTWNGEGELASKRVLGTPAVIQYSWDSDQHLLGSTTTGSSTVNEYDPVGRLISTISNGIPTSYLWDGATLIQEAGAGQGTHNLVTEPPTGDPTAAPARTVEDIGAAGRAYPLTNLHGDTTGATADNGQLSGAVIEYSAFGMPNRSSSAISGYDGYLPATAGLDYAYARWYSPSSGTFLSIDPIPNGAVYSYTSSDPINGFDPTGREELVEESVADEEGAQEAEAACKAFNEEQVIVVDWAQAYSRGISLADGLALVSLALEVGLPARGPESHPGRPIGQFPHFHCGPINHIPLKG